MINPYMPYFASSNVGDKCFSAFDGCVEIQGFINDDYPRRIIASNVRYANNGCHWTSDKPPTLFNSFQQFMHYWEWENKQEGGK